uniref:Uncharacterized protein n=1 Tax=Rubinisphaera brasiliensis (strain ATCC 49424 / DSM 5305 / JCM 21570 / IAM 15109 / NBRC 103401 / IFAM 1448) TaxID=756272 RepID=F0STL1_RUBBR|nr:hypothetical protein Plabr_3903 [Rubinisphaera brasiliensis DSM 5305]
MALFSGENSLKDRPAPLPHFPCMKCIPDMPKMHWEMSMDLPILGLCRSVGWP